MKNPDLEKPVALPPPQTDGSQTLEQVLARRRSVREFTSAQLTERQVSQLLWAAQGISSDEGYRTAPSAGALYPLELYVVLADGLFQYESEHHRLQRRNSQDLREALYRAALSQDAVRTAPAVFALTSVYERTARKYGKQRTPRYVHMEAGHAGQNLLLEATALGLAAVPIGAFDDPQVSHVLALSDDEAPLYLIPVGHAA